MIGVRNVTAVLGIAAAGLVMDAYGRRACGVPGLVLLAVGIFGTAAAPSVASLWAIHALLGLADTGALAVALVGLALAFKADEELLMYIRSADKKKPPVYTEGLWRLSRHPNRLGEHLWWLALAGAACCANGGFCPTALGPLIVCFGDASVDVPLLDRHVAMRRDRIKAWMAYAERVPALWPTPGSVLRFFKPSATEAKKGE